MNEARDFARLIFRDVPDDLRIGISRPSNKWKIEPYHSAEGLAGVNGNSGDVYIRASLVHDHVTTGRGSAADTAAIVGLWLEIDINGTPDGNGGVKSGVAPNRDKALRLAHAIAEPTVLVDSGGGIHAWWLADKRPIRIDPAQREAVEQFLWDWQQAHRERVPWSIDSTHDLARILRLPGTHNNKSGQPRAVRVISDAGPEYRLADLRKLVPETTMPKRATVAAGIIIPADFVEVDDERLLDLLTRERGDDSDDDYAICCAAYELDYTDEAMAKMLIERRRSYGDSKADDRPDYITRTITAAKQRVDDGFPRFPRLSRSPDADPFPRIPRLSRTNEENEEEDAEDPWPTLDDIALQGLAGDVVRTIDPHTEADPVAVLLTFLAGYGAMIGRTAYCQVGGDRHYPLIWPNLVGDTSSGRKGSAFSATSEILRLADPLMASERTKTGLSSGEGLIHEVRDAVVQRQPVKDKGKVTGYQEVETDPGIKDKRLLVYEEEFARVLRVANRDGNTLSAILRDAWGRDRLGSITRQAPIRATGAHIVVTGHITQDELKRELAESEAANGFANRFLWALVRRSKLLPDGGRLYSVDLEPLAEHIRETTEYAKSLQRVDRSPDARALWHDVYEDLTSGRPGMLGAVTARGAAQVLRLSLLFSTLGESSQIDLEHLQAALAVWAYCEQSAALIFGDSLGDPMADDILEALRKHQTDGLSRNDLRDLFGRHKSSNRLGHALDVLLRAGLARTDKKETRGRPAEYWYAVRDKRGKRGKVAA